MTIDICQKQSRDIHNVA